MNVRYPFAKRLIDAATMFFVSGMSLFLLIYVGIGEGQRTYEQFFLEKIRAEGRVVQSAMETFLRAGLPMKQFVGFTTIVEPVLAADESISALAAYNADGNMIFTKGKRAIPLLPDVVSSNWEDGEPYEVRRDGTFHQVVLPLRNKFELVGRLAITIPQSVVGNRVRSSFDSLLLLGIALSLGFAVFVSISGPMLKNQRAPWLQIVYAVVFATMSVAVIGTMVSLYSEGAQAKTKALADSLGHRLKEIVEFNLNIREIDGIDRMFAEYQRLNPDISAAALTIDGWIEIHTDPTLKGTSWVSENRTYEYVVDLTPADNARNIRVAVALPVNVVFKRILRSVKNFAALFVASAFLAGLFLQIAGTIHKPLPSREGSAARSPIALSDDALLSLVKPVFFVAVFIEHLNYAFLPQFMLEVAAGETLSTGYASVPFVAYYLFFAIALVPSGQYAQNFCSRSLMYTGLVLAGFGFFILAFFPVNFGVAVVARSISGVGQGMLFIGVQSYILAQASPGKRTRGAAIIVLGFQGGMISGMAIGSLLVTYIGPIGVFNLSAVIAFALAVYTIIVVPTQTTPLARAAMHGFNAGLQKLIASAGQMARNVEFLKAMFLIGIPAKAVLTGVIIFALPLLLAKNGYPAEDIGQIIMIYAAAVVLSSSYASRLADRIGRTHEILFWGSVISAIGLLLIATMDWKPAGAAEAGTAATTGILILGVAIVGVAHGFINAPVVTHVADSPLARKIGESSLTANYRFLERIGHIAGPILVSQLFLLSGQSAQFMVWIAGAIMLSGLIFVMRTTRVPASGHEQEVT